ncbi:MAG: Trm112 family protein [Pseudomonadota bacterium]
MTHSNSDPVLGPCGVSPRLLEVLICPVTGGPLIFDKDACELISKKAKLAYPIRDGLPILLETEARDLDAPAA